MEQFKPRDIITPIVEFIKTCPFAEEFGVDVDNISIQSFDDGENEGSIIEYTGSVSVDELSDLTGGQYITRQANFNLFLLKKNNRDLYRKETADFLFNFEQWIEHCQIFGLTPKIGNDEYEHGEEFMFADNGAFFGDYGNEDESLYAIQIHIIYKNTY